MSRIESRLSRLEGNSHWGSSADLAASAMLVIRVLPGSDGDRRALDPQARAMPSGKFLRITSSPKAADLPLGRVVPLERVPDDLLSEFIAETQARVELLDASP